MHIRSVVTGGLAALGVAVLLAACGGGGTASNTPTPVKNAAVPVGEVDSGAKPNPDGFAFPNFGAAATPSEFNASDMSTMFSSGPDICVQSSGECELSAEARAWARMVNQARVSGHCEGLAVLASTRFIGNELPKTITLAQQEELTHAIMRAFATQFLDETQEATKTWAKKSPSEIVSALVESLKTGAPKFTLGVYTDSGGHAVLPYAVEFPSANIANIMVYDSNWPGMNRYVEVNLAEESWKFSFSGADPVSDPQVWQGGAGDIDITPLQARIDGTCPFCGGKVGVQKSLLLIRSAKPDWSIQSADGKLTPGSQIVGESVVRPLRSALPPRPDLADANRQGPTDYLVFTNLSGKGVSLKIGSTTRIVGVTPQAIFEIDSQSTAPSVEIQISDVQVAVDDPQVGLTLSNENSVASSAGNANTVSAVGDGITVNITTDEGEALEFKTSEEAPAIDVRTGSANGATEGAKYEVFTQVSPSETEHVVVFDDGEKSTTRQQGQLENQKTTTKLPEVLDAPLVKAGLPPPDAREFNGTPDLSTATVETTTTTTVAPTTTTTTTTAAPIPTTTVAPTTTTTVAPTTTTTTTIPVAPTAAPSEGDILALPIVDPALPLRASSAFSPGDEVTVRYSGLVPRQWVQLVVASTPEVLDTALADASGSISLSGRVPASLQPGTHQLAVFQPQTKTGIRQVMTYALPVSPPSAPRSVSVVASSAQATVSWVAPSSNGGAAITSYLVTSTPGVHSCTYTVPAGGAASPSCTVFGLTNGRSYTFTVSATNSAGTSEQSAPSASAIPVTTPSAPMSVVGTSGDGRVNLSWSTPLQNGGTEITDYEVWYSAFSIGPFITFPEPTSTNRTAAVTGLTNGSTYYFKIVAVNAVGLGETSAMSAGVVPAAVPGVPTSVLAERGDELATISWVAPASNGATITSYTATSNPGGLTCVWASGPLSCDVLGLTNGTSYTFTVSATNSVGEGNPSSASQAVVPAAVPGMPTSLSGSSGNGSVSLTWSAPTAVGGSGILDYVIEYSSNSGATWATFADGTSTTASATVTGLTNGTSYIFRVAATNTVGSGQHSTASSAVVPSTTPGAPNIGSITASNASLSVAFTAGDSGGSVITSYKYSTDGGTTFRTRAAGTTASPLVISTLSSDGTTALVNGTSYSVQIKAVNAIGDGTASSSVSGVPVTVPGAPTSVSGVGGAGQVTVTWSAPASTGGATISSYTVTSSGGQSCSWSSGPLSCVVTGLGNGVAYTFTVTASNSAGEGTASSVSSSVTPLAAAPVLGTVSSGNGQITFNWGAVTHGGDTYRVYWGTDPTWASAYSFTSSGGSTSYTATGLTNGTTYYFRVAGWNNGLSPQVGTTAWSVNGSAVPSTTPGAPTIGSITASNASLSVAFTAGDSGGSAITSYKYSTDGGTTFRTRAAGTTASPLVISTLSSDGTTALVNGTSYSVQIKAVNANGDGVASATTGSIPSTTPSAPTIGSITASNASLSVAFTAGDSGGSSITSYKYSTDGGTTFRTRAAGTTASPLVISTLSSDGTTALVNGTSYSVQIKAVNANGDGVASATTGSIPSTTPSAPTIGSITASNASLSVAFTAGDSGGSSITSYKYSTDGGTTFRTRAAGTTASPLVISTLSSDGTTALVNGTSYSVQIKAVNANGDGVASATTGSIPSTTPSAPTIGSITASNASLSVAFTAGDSGGSSITSYKYSTDGGTTFRTRAAGTTASPLVISTLSSDGTTALVNGTSYSVQIKAVNANGDGVASATTGSIPSTTPSAPTIGSITASNASLSVAFTAGDSGGSSITSYKYSTDGGTTFRTRAAGTTASPLVISTLSSDGTTALVNGTSYSVQIKAVNANGDGVASATTGSIPSTTPSAPTIGSITASNASLSVAFTAGDSGGSSITSYKYSTDGGTTFRTRAAGTTASPLVISTLSSDGTTALVNGTSYSVQIKAVNAIGDGTASSTTAATPLADVPGTPTTVSGTKGNESLTVAWPVPASNGSAITDYEIYIGTSASGSFSLIADAVSATPGATVSGLTNGTTYYIKVAAVNSVGSGTVSAVSAAITPSAPCTTACAVGDVGPAGGIVFMTPATVGNATGRYFEAAPAGWSGTGIDLNIAWCNATSTLIGTPSALGTAIGTGSSNTDAIVAVCSTGAAKSARAYTGGGASDWFLPSIDELLQMYTNRAAIGGLVQTTQVGTGGSTTTFWSSSEYNSYQSKNWSFLTNGNDNWGKNYGFGVRPVRMFSAPGVPTISSITASNASLSVAFTAGTTGGSAITGYKYSTDGGTTFITRAAGTTASPLVISTLSSDGLTALTNGTSYNIQIKAVNAIGDGTATSSTAATPLTLATAVLMTTQPVGGTSGAVLATQPVVRIVDSTNNTVTTSTASVTVTASGGTLGGTTTVTAVNGVATFTNLTHTTAGTYTLTFASTSLTSVTSASFTTGAATCANGGACALGETGPGGGKVFYVAGSNFTSTGSDCGTACKYLEAALSDHSSAVAWCSNTSTSLGVTAIGIGSGMSNTTTADSTCTSGAIQVAADYTNNGKTDWHLPSKDELAQLYAEKTRFAGFSYDYYWSSSEYSAGAARTQNFLYGYQDYSGKHNSVHKVRLVRAFGTP